MSFIFIKIGSLDFVVQSYKQKDFVNIVTTSQIPAGIRIDIHTKKIDTYGLQTPEFKNLITQIDIEKIITTIENLHP